MAFFQSSTALRRLTPPRALSSGSVMVARFPFVFSTAFTFATDKLELGVLPAFANVCDAVLIGAIGAVCTANVGIMSGDVGDPNAARTIGSEFFSATDINAAVTRMSLATGFQFAKADYDRSIGLTTTANITASPSKKVELLLFYTL